MAPNPSTVLIIDKAKGSNELLSSARHQYGKTQDPTSPEENFSIPIANMNFWDPTMVWPLSMLLEKQDYIYSKYISHNLPKKNTDLLSPFV
jgi:hypothetical protein